MCTPERDELNTFLMKLLDTIKQLPKHEVKHFESLICEILKVGGVSKITVRFGDSINRAAVEIPRRIINQEILKELDKGKYFKRT